MGIPGARAGAWRPVGISPHAAGSDLSEAGNAEATAKTGSAKMDAASCPDPG